MHGRLSERIPRLIVCRSGGTLTGGRRLHDLTSDGSTVGEAQIAWLLPFGITTSQNPWDIAQGLSSRYLWCCANKKVRAHGVTSFTYFWLAVTRPIVPSSWVRVTPLRPMGHSTCTAASPCFVIATVTMSSTAHGTDSLRDVPRR